MTISEDNAKRKTEMERNTLEVANGLKTVLQYQVFDTKAVLNSLNFCNTPEKKSAALWVISEFLCQLPHPTKKILDPSQSKQYNHDAPEILVLETDDVIITQWNVENARRKAILTSLVENQTVMNLLASYVVQCDGTSEVKIDPNNANKIVDASSLDENVLISPAVFNQLRQIRAENDSRPFDVALTNAIAQAKKERKPVTVFAENILASNRNWYSYFFHTQAKKTVAALFKYKALSQNDSESLKTQVLERLNIRISELESAKGWIKVRDTEKEEALKTLRNNINALDDNVTAPVILEKITDWRNHSTDKNNEKIKAPRSRFSVLHNKDARTTTELMIDSMILDLNIKASYTIS